MGRLARIGGERDLRSVRSDVVVPGRIHEVEPARAFRREIDERARREIEHEEMGALAPREPLVPEAIDAVRRHVRLHRILSALLEELLRPGGRRRVREEERDERDPLPVREPAGIHRAERHLGEALGLAPEEREHVDLRLLVSLAPRVEELLAVG
jgi:hypothetical protein